MNRSRPEDKKDKGKNEEEIDPPSLSLPPLNPPPSVGADSGSGENKQEEASDPFSLALPPLQAPPPRGLPSWAREEWETLDEATQEKVREILSGLEPPKEEKGLSGTQAEDKRETQTRTTSAQIKQPQPLANPSDVTLFVKKKKHNPFKEVNVGSTIGSILGRVSALEKQLGRTFVNDFSQIRQILENSKANGVQQCSQEQAKIFNDFVRAWGAIGGDPMILMRINYIIRETPSLQISKPESKIKGPGHSE